MKNIYTSWEQVPLYLTIDELALLMGISRAGAYSLAHSEGFPLTRWGKVSFNCGSSSFNNRTSALVETPLCCKT